MSEEKEVKKTHISRREFLKDAGLIVGGAAIGSLALANACKGETVTTTVTQGVSGGGGGSAAISEDETLINFTVNGTPQNIVVKNHHSLAWVLREKLALFGTKIGCDMGQCGSCTVLVDNLPVYGCVMLACEAGGKKVDTVEGLSSGTKLSPLQQKFYDKEAVQCGYCTPGFLMAAEGLLRANSRPTEGQVRLALSGHLCMCQSFKKTVEAVTGGV